MGLAMKQKGYEKTTKNKSVSTASKYSFKCLSLTMSTS